MTVTGLNFRTKDLTPTSALGINSCSTTSWSSKSSVVCRTIVDSKTAALDFVGVTADSIVGTRTGWFTFDGMRVENNWRSCS